MSCNLAIIAHLYALVIKYPELRFQQIIYLLGINTNEIDESGEVHCLVDRYYEESEKTLKRVESRLSDIDTF